MKHYIAKLETIWLVLIFLNFWEAGRLLGINEILYVSKTKSYYIFLDRVLQCRTERNHRFYKRAQEKKKRKKNFLNKEAVAMCKYQPLLSRNFYMQINYCLSEFPLHLLVDFRKLEFSSKWDKFLFPIYHTSHFLPPEVALGGCAWLSFRNKHPPSLLCAYSITLVPPWIPWRSPRSQKTTASRLSLLHPTPSSASCWSLPQMTQ